MTTCIICKVGHITVPDTFFYSGWRFNSELQVVPTNPVDGIVALLVDGSRIEARRVAVAGETTEFETSFGET